MTSPDTDAPVALHRGPRERRIVSAPTSLAAETIGTLTPGVSIVGLTKGQFSLMDLVIAVLDQVGVADVIVSTWTADLRDAAMVRSLVMNERIRSFRLLCDRSLLARDPAYVETLLEFFGPEAIRTSRTHAKLALIGNDRWHVAIRTSMNLNRNTRFEQFDLDDDPAVYEFLRAHVAELVESMPPGFVVPAATIDAAFREALGGGLAEGVDLDAGDDEDSMSTTDDDVFALMRGLDGPAGA